MFHVVYRILLFVIYTLAVADPSVGEERAIFSAILFTYNYVVSVRRDFLFLLVLGIGCVIYCCTPWAFHIIT